MNIIYTGNRTYINTGKIISIVLQANGEYKVNLENAEYVYINQKIFDKICDNKE